MARWQTLDCDVIGDLLQSTSFKQEDLDMALLAGAARKFNYTTVVLSKDIQARVLPIRRK